MIRRFDVPAPTHDDRMRAILWRYWRVVELPAEALCVAAVRRL
jgi:hypothetical protein